MKEILKLNNEPAIELMDKNGIEGLLFDYDDTLCATAAYMGWVMEVYAAKVARKLSIDSEIVLERVNYHNNRLYKEYFVNPIRWNKTSECVSLDLTGRIDALKREERVFMRIFDNVPELFPGAKGILRDLSRSGKKIGMVTHAPLDWTMLKLERHGIVGYFDHLQLADVDKHKSIEDWRLGISGLGLQPWQVIGIGDSVSGDVIPMLELGVRVLALPNSWSVNNAVLPKEAVLIDRIGDYFEGIERILAGKI